ncbi:MAG TPA: aminotransferase class I/II-fold pyridoxal phosphate-dependent enzyme, partial [Spirochaetota bacterium]|nr:aminotransferase class I/II-fold pyridoxal phosphate-dependent enzyme [Spirochaetota bacterium]
ALKYAKNDVKAMQTIYNERRQYMIQGLKRLGFAVHVEPTGAFYVFADARKFCSDSYSEAFNIIETVKVGVTPGIDFGSAGEGFLRFSYATSIENIEEGLKRIEQYLKNR